MMASFDRGLPVEQWWQVLVNVPPKDLCNVMLTSRHMNRVASLPQLWAGMKISLRKVRENGLAEMYNINRFKKIRQMDLSTMEFTLEELEKILNDIPRSPLEDINFEFIMLIIDPTELLARKVDYLSLSEVPTDLLTRAICHLRSVNLNNTELTTEQCISILEASLASKTLVNVELDHINLSQIPAELLSKAICRLETIRLSKTHLTTGQFIRVLEASLSSNTLVKIDLSFTNLMEVPAQLLAKAVSRQRTIDLSSARITTEQRIRVLEASLSSNTLVNVDLHHIYLNQVPAELLSTAICRLKTISLCTTNMTSSQSTKVLEAILSSNTLHHVNLSCNNLSEVSADLLARAVSRLKTVDLSNTRMTSEQCVKVLEASLSSNTLVNVGLASLLLHEVPEELLVRAVSRLDVLNLYNSHLTTDQRDAVVNATHSSTKLQHTYILETENEHGHGQL